MLCSKHMCLVEESYGQVYFRFSDLFQNRMFRVLVNQSVPQNFNVGMSYHILI